MLTFLTKSGLVSLIAMIAVVPGSSVLGAGTHPKASGRESVAAVRHDWKKHVHATVHVQKTSVKSVPANFGSLSPEARLAYLHDRRNVDSTRFDSFHPYLGPLLAADDRLRAAESQGLSTMNGLLPNNALTRYLDYRRGLNPVRFDHYHPSLGAILAEDQRLKKALVVSAPEIIPPVMVSAPPGGAPAAGPPVGGGELPVRPVPEPTGLVLVLVGTALVSARAIASRRRRISAKAE